MAKTLTILAALDRFIETFKTVGSVESGQGLATSKQGVATAKAAENQGFGHFGHCGQSKSDSADNEHHQPDHDRPDEVIAPKVLFSDGYNGNSGQTQGYCGFERDHSANDSGHNGQSCSGQPASDRHEIDYHPPDIAAARSFAADLETDPEHWRQLYEERAAIRQFDGGYSRDLAERLAWGEMEWRWHMAHGAPAVLGVCAGCREPIGNKPLISLIDGNVVHDQRGHACLIRFGEYWRGAARASLIALGLNPPADLQ
jgi:hypothetical protein